jgi:hypothetical protein
MMRIVSPRIVVAVIILSSCRLFNAPAVECEGDVPVSLAKLPEGPTILWGGSCAMTRIAVVEAASERVVWGVEFPENAPVTAPVRYGHAPSVASEWKQSEPLRRGVTYYVSIGRVVGGDVYSAYGKFTFTY